MNGRCIQISEELNGRGPKNEAPDQGGIKILKALNGKGSQNFRRYAPFLAKMNLDLCICMLILRGHHKNV